MHFKNLWISALITAFTVFKAMPQSPITNTPFYQAYLDFGIVKRAEAKGIMDEQLAQYLLSPKIALDLKAAIINALSFEISGKNNADLFIQYLNEKYTSEDLKQYIHKLNADELFCLGYLKVMDDYFSPEEAIPYLEAAKTKLPEAYIVHLVLAITKAQLVYRSDKCKAYQLVEEVNINPDLIVRMLPEGREIVAEYFDTLRAYCK